MGVVPDFRADHPQTEKKFRRVAPDPTFFEHEATSIASHRRGVLRRLSAPALIGMEACGKPNEADNELTLAATTPDRAEKFDKKAMNGDDLYRWSSLRSYYVAVEVPVCRQRPRGSYFT